MSASPGTPLEGVVIKRSDYSEYDRIITIYSPTHGKLNTLAKGIRKPGSKRAGSLELFNHIRTQVRFMPTGIGILTEVKIIESHANWRGHLGRVALAYQAVEAIDKLTPDSLPQPDLYVLLTDFLLEIGTLGINWRERTLHNLRQILHTLGHIDPQNPPSNLLQTAEEAAGKKLYAPRILSRLSSNPLVK